MTVLRIFLMFFRAGALTLGGGMAIVSVLRHELVVRRSWLGEDDFSQNLAMATSLPGAIVVNFSIFSGYRMKGVPGAAAAFLGTVLPSLLAVTAVVVLLSPHFSHPAAAAFLRGAMAAVAGLLAYTAVAMCRPMVARASHLAAAVAAALLALVPTVNPIFALILVTAVVFRLTIIRESRAAAASEKRFVGNDGGDSICEDGASKNGINSVDGIGTKGRGGP